MKKKASNVVDKPVKKTKKLKDMSLDDFMNSLGDSGSDSVSEDEQEQEHAPQTKTTNGHSRSNGHLAHVSNENLDRSHKEESEDDDDDDSCEEEEEVAEEDESQDEVEVDSEDQSEEEEEEVDGEDESGEEEEGVDGEDESGEEEEEVDGEDESGEEEHGLDDVESGDESDEGHKKSLNKLKDLDPEFYKYLEENDKKLLQFNASDSDETGSEDDEEQVHHPSKLDSDESDFEPEGDDEEPSGRKHGVVTLKMVENWRASLQSDKTVQTISDVIQAFHAALLRVAPEDERSQCIFKVESSAVFNAVVQMCVLDLLPALRKYLNVTDGSLSHMNPVKCKRWPKVKTLIRSYVADILQLLQGVASVNISTIILKHLHQMTPFVVCFGNIVKPFLKRMISLWSTGEETVRVVAFMCILRATSLQQQTLLDQTIRHMYLAYVQNTKFVSPNTLPGINFMRRSLSEILLLDENVSYHHAFLYIRQLAIHLRNAITLQKKEAIQSVYNWQFVSSLALWIELLGASTKQVLHPLLYPVVQITTGAIKLVPTAQYYPLRFHCARLLVSLSRNTGTFIPVLPFLLEILNSYDFNKKHSKMSMKPLDLSCVLRVSKTQQAENGFKDAIIENIYNIILECLASDSHSIAFPDLALPTIFQLKDFLKKCKVANYSRKLKQILEKVEENAKFVENERKTATFSLSDSKSISNWETALKVKGTPLETYFNSWKKMNDAKEAKLKENTLDMSEKIPKIVRPKKKRSAEGPVTLLPSDDSDSDGINFGEEEELTKKVRGKRGKGGKGTAGKKRVKVLDEPIDDGVEDVVEDMDLSEW